MHRLKAKLKLFANLQDENATIARAATRQPPSAMAWSYARMPENCPPRHQGSPPFFAKHLSELQQEGKSRVNNLNLEPARGQPQVATCATQTKTAQPKRPPPQDGAPAPRELPSPVALPSPGDLPPAPSPLGPPPASEQTAEDKAEPSSIVDPASAKPSRGLESFRDKWQDEIFKNLPSDPAWSN